MSEAALLRDAAAFLEGEGIGAAPVALVLGSGFAAAAAALQDAVEVPCSAVPGWPAPAVAGHGGAVVHGRLGGARVLCLTGRVHLYEGREPAEVVRAVRTLRLLGAQAFLLTNAAGGLRDGLRPGDLMAIRDHLNLTGRSPLAGPHEAELGPRFPDQSAVWDAELRGHLRAADPGLTEGVYAGLPGPAYETPAEVRMLRALGADAVGMSTVLEATALHAMGARVAGVSLISNLAAGIARTPLRHEEVLEAGEKAQDRLTALLAAFCARLGPP